MFNRNWSSAMVWMAVRDCEAKVWWARWIPEARSILIACQASRHHLHCDAPTVMFGLPTPAVLHKQPRLGGAPISRAIIQLWNTLAHMLQAHAALGGGRSSWCPQLWTVQQPRVWNARRVREARNTASFLILCPAVCCWLGLWLTPFSRAAVPAPRSYSAHSLPSSRRVQKPKEKLLSRSLVAIAPPVAVLLSRCGDCRCLFSPAVHRYLPLSFTASVCVGHGPLGLSAAQPHMSGRGRLQVAERLEVRSSSFSLPLLPTDGNLHLAGYANTLATHGACLQRTYLTSTHLSTFQPQLHLDLS